MKKDIWVMVANSAKARIFKAENQLLKEIEILEHPESRLHDRDLVSSKPGRTYDSVGPGRHAIEPLTSPKLNEFNFFAKTLSTFLHEAQRQGHFDRLYIIAPPTFLGLLRETLSPSTVQLIAGEVNKDITTFEPEVIRGHLPFML